MGRIRPFETLAYSIACYNIAWGLGGAIGPFFGGALRDLGLGYGSFALVVAALVVAHGLLLGLSRTPEPDDPPPTAAFESTARQRKFAWINFFVVGLAFRGLYGTLWPDLGKQMQWADWKIGLGQTLMLFPVAGAALVWARCRRRLVEPWFMIGSMVIGAAAFSALPWMDHWPSAVACCLVIGVMESCVVYHSLYYANADAHTKGRSLGIAEAMAGSGFLFGPLIFGLLAWNNAKGPLPYTVGSVFILTVATVCLQDRLRGGPYAVTPSPR